MISALIYACGFVLICYEAMKHGAVQAALASLWFFAVLVYGMVGAQIVRALNRRGDAVPRTPRPGVSAMIAAARRADAEQRSKTGPAA